MDRRLWRRTRKARGVDAGVLRQGRRGDARPDYVLQPDGSEGCGEHQAAVAECGEGFRSLPLFGFRRLQRVDEPFVGRCGQVPSRRRVAPCRARLFAAGREPARHDPALRRLQDGDWGVPRQADAELHARHGIPHPRQHRRRIDLRDSTDGHGPDGGRVHARVGRRRARHRRPHRLLSAGRPAGGHGLDGGRDGRAHRERLQQHGRERVSVCRRQAGARGDGRRRADGTGVRRDERRAREIRLCVRQRRQAVPGTHVRAVHERCDEALSDDGQRPRQRLFRDPETGERPCRRVNVDVRVVRQVRADRREADPV